MRISTATFNNNAVTQMDALETALEQTEQQLSTGSRIQSAADDPTGMAQVNQMNVEISASTQYVTNSNTAQTNLELEEQALSNASNVMQSAVTLAGEANNSALSRRTGRTSPHSCNRNWKASSPRPTRPTATATTCSAATPTPACRSPSPAAR